MARVNVRAESLHTHEGAKAKHINAEQQLRRTVMSCMLWEREFYEDGVSIADRIAALVPSVPLDVLVGIAIHAREKMKLRHVPLFLLREAVRFWSSRRINRMTVDDSVGGALSDALARVIQRPDELAEFLAMYWADGRKPVASAVKRGLAQAFGKFNAYQLAKWNKDGKVKLRDVLRVCHAKPKDEEQAALWKQLNEDALPTPDTWETALSGGADKRETWTRLLAEGKLGALALLRNLRNMQKVEVDMDNIKSALAVMKTERVLPYRFIAASRYAPSLEPELESAMFRCVADHAKLRGKTILLVDVSGSMDDPLSSKSDLKRIDAACGLAMLLRETCEDLRVFTFSQRTVEVPLRRGFALRDAIVGSQLHGSTYLGAACQHAFTIGHDRIIVITDEQSHDRVPDPCGAGYMLNVASYQNGIGYGPWLHVDGFSEAVLDFIQEFEGE